MQTETEAVQTDEDAPRYQLWGGSSRALPEWGDEGETFDTLELAVPEWLRRRQDWTGRFPMWGDLDPFADPCIVLGTECETFEGWTVVDMLHDTGRDGDLFHYYDQPDCDEDEDGYCTGACLVRPHKWSASGARCTRTGCNVAGTGDPCNDGNCEGRD